MEVLDLENSKQKQLRKNHKHGKFSSVLFLIYILTVIPTGVFLMFKISAMIEVINKTDYIERNQLLKDLKQMYVYYGGAIVIGVIVNIIGFTFGVSAIVKRNYSMKSLGWIGMVGNGIFLLIFIGMVVIGLMRRGF